MRTIALRWITKNIRGRPGTVSQLIITRHRIQALLRLVAMLAGACFLAWQGWAIIQLAFAL